MRGGHLSHFFFFFIKAQKVECAQSLSTISNCVNIFLTFLQVAVFT